MPSSSMEVFKRPNHDRKHSISEGDRGKMVSHLTILACQREMFHPSQSVSPLPCAQYATHFLLSRHHRRWVRIMTAF
jgi:hypothetical protein